jgi:hypothetical protein
LEQLSIGGKTPKEGKAFGGKGKLKNLGEASSERGTPLGKIRKRGKKGKPPALKRGKGIEEWGNLFFFLFSIQYYYCYYCENYYEVIAKSEEKEWYLVIRYGKTIICVWKNGFACGKMIW